MIRNILVIARSGVVLFSKEFQGSLKQVRKLEVMTMANR
jgi:hypothetical protein